MFEIRGFLQDLSRQDWWHRRDSIKRLLELKEGEYFPYLEEGIRNHEDACLRNSAMEVYENLGVRSLSSLASLLKDADPEVRLFAVNVFSRIRSAEALPFLYPLIGDEDINVRAAAVEAMGMIGDERAVKVLEKALSDDPWVATAAIMAMGEIGGEAGRAVLYRCIERKLHPDYAIMALDKAGNRNSIGHLTSCLKTPALRERSLKAIIRIAEREHVRPNPEYFMGLVRVLFDMLHSADPEIRKYSLIAISWLEDISAIPILIEAVRDEEIQEYGIEGLLRIGRRAVCAIVDELKGSTGGNRVILAKLLSMIGEPMALLQFAGDWDEEVRTEVALALGSLELDRAVLTLLDMRSDISDEVRAAAEISLGLLAERRSKRACDNSFEPPAAG